MNVLLVSGTGLLGSRLAARLIREGLPHTATSRATLDLEKPVRSQLEELGKFTHAILCAAVADVDQCFREKARSRRVNVEAVGELAGLLAEAEINVAYFSTDLVFDCEADLLRGEEEPVSPSTEYGRQKVEAEAIVRASSPSALIFRTSKMMSFEPHPRSILTPLTRGGEFRAFRDQFITPVFAEDVAEVTLAAFRRKLSGTYHVAGDARVSRVELANLVYAAFEMDSSKIRQISMADAALAEPRGPYHTLSAGKLARDAGFRATPLATGIELLKASCGKVNP